MTGEDVPTILARLDTMEGRLARVENDLHGMRESAAGRSADMAALMTRMSHWERDMRDWLERAERRDAAMNASLRQINLTVLGVAGGIVVALLGGIFALVEYLP